MQLDLFAVCACIRRIVSSGRKASQNSGAGWAGMGSENAAGRMGVSGQESWSRRCGYSPESFAAFSGSTGNTSRSST